jgi:hypothetical protein
MRSKPRRRRAPGSLSQLKARLWAGIEYATGLVEEHTATHEIRLQALTSLVQAATAYARIVDLHEKEKELQQLEALAAQVRGNGHRA